jgi:hypothetical protein
MAEPTYTLKVTFDDFHSFLAIYQEMESRMELAETGLVSAQWEGDPSLMPPEAKKWWRIDA